MFRQCLLVLICLLLSACAFQTEGASDLIPTTWRAWVDCDGPVPVAPGETASLPNDWQCIAQEPSDTRGSVTCWRAGATFELVALCKNHEGKASAVIEGCTIQLACR